MKLANKELRSNNLSSNLQHEKFCWTELLEGSSVDFKYHSKMFQQINF